MSADPTRLVLLGTAGGPLPSPIRSGISQAIVVGERVYLVDCGSGVTRQLRRTRLLRHLHEVFLTHLHSDHDCDYFNLFLLGWPILQWNPPVDVYGPGSAGGLPPAPADLPAGHRIAVVNPANPTPGLADLTRAQFQAHAYDINIRTREAGRLDLTSLVVPHEIILPAALRAGPTAVAPAMDPIVVTEDDRVRVTAVLVEHAPVFPSFAYRFDTDAGSIVISGDTAPCANLITLARGANVLVHEVFDDAARTDDDGSWEAKQREQHLVRAHTPLSRIAAVAAESQVGRLVLTHFILGDDALPDEHWQRAIADGFDGEVIVGSDELEVRL
ncbi:MAG: MBL fold metallo-hydrolase [Solirubrobacterales bacterium]|nr:MBL fold metallo-hydrolase [Solirubrobacterales bacterium]